jgi:hypothetical protein
MPGTADRSGIAAGTQILADLPLLSGQAGTAPDLILRWNDMPARARSLDLVLHLHGYAMTGARLNIETAKLPISGLDFGDPDRAPGSTAGRNRPTLCLLPRGRFFGGRTGNGYDFPVLAEPPGTTHLVRLARSLFRARWNCGPLPGGRRVLTAHSGGGAALVPVAAQFEPHEIHVFDGLYAEAPGLIDWVRRAIATDAAALRRAGTGRLGSLMERQGHALRVLYITATGTEPASREIGAAIDQALAAAGDAGRSLAPWYRVEAVPVDHLRIPRAYGWQLLADAGGALV